MQEQFRVDSLIDIDISSGSQPDKYAEVGRFFASFEFQTLNYGQALVRYRNFAWNVCKNYFAAAWNPWELVQIDNPYHSFSVGEG